MFTVGLASEIRRIAGSLKPQMAILDRKLRHCLRREKGYDAKQIKAITAITLGSAAKMFMTGGSPEDFLEQVEYSGRRLTKLNLSPDEVVQALRVFDVLFNEALRAGEFTLPVDTGEFERIRERFFLCVMISLNNAFHQIRQGEAQAFYDLLRAELEAKSLDELLRQFLENLTRISQAQVGRLVLLTEAAMAALCCALAVNSLLPQPRAWVLILMASLFAACNAVHRPAIEALTPRIVPLELLPSVAALSAFRYSVTFIVGASLAGVVTSKFGAATGYTFDAATFIVSFVMLLLMRAAPPPEDADRPSLRSIKEGLLYARSRQELLGTYLIDIIAMFFGSSCRSASSVTIHWPAACWNPHVSAADLPRLRRNENSRMTGRLSAIVLSFWNDPSVEPSSTKTIS